MKKKEIALKSIEVLKEIYPIAKCSLVYSKPYELLIATRLSAQCTDARVNIITKDLFKKYTSIQDFANADINVLENDIKSCGFYRTKAKSIIEMANTLIEKFNGEIPNNMTDLISLSGIGRKTANLIMGDIWGEPAIVTDTHCIRITGRLGLTENENPKKVEDDLRDVLPPEESSDFCHRLVDFGREICKARNPKCTICKLNSICSFYKNIKK